MLQDTVTVHDAAATLDVSVDTIRRWAKKGLVKASRDESNYRVFKLNDLLQLKKKIAGKDIRPFTVLKAKPTRFTTIELFAGAGGLALGLENAGFQHSMLVEVDQDCVDTLSQNRKDWFVVPEDIATVDFNKYAGLIDVVTGGFPCQAFSYAGKSRGFGETRGTLFFEFARCISEVRPPLAIFENVRGLLNHDNGRTLQTMIDVLNDLGYNTSHRVLRAQFFDVAQKRERLVLFALRKDFGSTVYFPTEKDYIVTLREALKNCPDSPGTSYSPAKYSVMKQVPEGGNWRQLSVDQQKLYMKGSFKLTGGKTGMARRLAWDEPSLTLTCNPAQKQTERCHPDETRPLSTREYARLQSFPDDWKFHGSVTSTYKQIGNAVPVNMAFQIGRAALKTLGHKVSETDFNKVTFN